MYMCVLGMGTDMACILDQILRRFNDPMTQKKAMNYCCKSPVNMGLRSDSRQCIPKHFQGSGRL